jgi:hypothetical protein
MKRYHLEVITGSDFGVDYEVEADTYDYSGSGCYTFYVRPNINSLEVVASYPINRTIIKRIEEI